MLISKDEIACAWTAVFLSVEVVSQKAFLWTLSVGPHGVKS
jgi:hypothetical protein